MPPQDGNGIEEVNDILEQLQAPHGYFGRTIRHQAAREISMLRASVASLKAALREKSPGMNKCASADLTAAYLAGYERGKDEARKAQGDI